MGGHVDMQRAGIALVPISAEKRTDGGKGKSKHVLTGKSKPKLARCT